MREKYNALEDYLNSLVPSDSALLLQAKAEASRLHKEGISIAPHEAHLLKFFVRQWKCQRFVELGTLTGYSALAILSALPPEGHLWTIERDETHAKIARTLFQQAGEENRVTLLIGRAEDHLPMLTKEGPFDGIFIDANKAAYPDYLDWALAHLKTGGLIVADNTLLNGVVPVLPPVESSTTPPMEEGSWSPKGPSKIIEQLRIFNRRLSDPELFDSILIPTAEGLSVAIKK